jgi:hypothetical protein
VAWSDLEDAAASTNVTLRLFVSLNVYNRDTDSTTTLYVSDGQFSTDAVDGTWREWDGRVSGQWTISKPDQKIGTSQWAHPTATFKLWIGDAADDYLTYIGEDYEWVGQQATVYLTAWADGELLGTQTQIHKGKVRKGPESVEFGKAHDIVVTDRHYGEALPVVKIGLPGITSSGFVGAACLTTSAAQTRSAVAAADTQINLYAGGGTNIRSGHVLLAADSAGGAGPTDGEQMYLSGVSQGGPVDVIWVRRGYNGTSALSLASGAYIYGFKPGADNWGAGNVTGKRHMPYVFNVGTANRGLLDMSMWTIGRTRDDYYNGGVGGLPCLAEIYVGAGTGYHVRQRWYRASGVVINSATTQTVYDDVNSQYGAILSYGDTPPTVAGGINSGHMRPHVMPAGSYYTGIPFANGTAPPLFNGYHQTPNDTQHWALVAGLTDTGVDTGTPIRYPAGIVKYLLTDSTWALGYTLSDVVYGNSITNWTTGDWVDEFTEAWGSNVEGAVPSRYSDELPEICDVLQELADVVNSDMFIKGGKLYPKRRTVAATADVTLDQTDFVESSQIRQLRDPHNAHCNKMIVGHEQPILAHPTTSDDLPSQNIPWTLDLRDYAELKRNGNVQRRLTLVRKWWRQRLSDSWIAQSSSQNPTHQFYWRDAHQEQLDQRAQPQIYVEAKLAPRLAYLEQGDTIAYDVDPFTSRLGQVRDIKITGGAAGASVTVRSWHIEF